MKIGILTFHNALNYGAVLQTYALQNELKKQGHDVKIINYFNSNIASKLERPEIKQYRNWLNYRRDLRIYSVNQERQENINKFVDNNLNLTKKISDDLTDIGEEFDVIFTGSDQVWNDKITKNDEHYYLDFIPKEKRCSYAASIGSDSIPLERVSRVQFLLSDFRAISVRETTAQVAIKNQLGIDSMRVLDPTFLLEMDDYNIKKNADKNDKYILLYMLLYSEKLLKSAKHFAKKLNLPVYCINASGRPVKGVTDFSTIGIEKWLELFAGAEYIFTNSFHGVAFSLNFNKQFNVELPPSRVNANSRILDVLDIFDLKDRIISDGKIVEEKIDFNKCNAILKAEREKSIKYLKEALSEPSKKSKLKNKTVTAIQPDRCSGCGMCSKICPVDAIKMVEDKKGFSYPSVDYETCIQCGKCWRECPSSNVGSKENVFNSQSVYAGYSNDSDTVYNSSSGGMFYEFAKQILSEGGCVYGAAFDEEYTLKHMRVTSIDQLEPLMGSKYMQSNAYEVFDDIVNDLHNNKSVLFVGTPCQVAALRRVCKNIDEKLYLIDFVCHGVPSPKLIKEHIKYVEKYFGSKVLRYKPRSKIAGWGHNELFVFANGKEEHLHPVSQAYKNIFYKDMGIRDSCFNCLYTNFDRPSDLTIADYWGIEKSRPELVCKEGLSMILENTDKGAVLLSNLKDITLNSTSVDTISTEKQPHLFRPLNKNSKQELFWKDYNRKGWKYIAEKYAECDRKSLIKYKIKKIIKYKHK